ncbi:biotin transporter BioY, partial [Klebsiella pneumoniae]|uniref:biotin transporter BioY n=2 Tax=Pseudomonadota TaxID=1224 RepID=UPI001954EF5D
TRSLAETFQPEGQLAKAVWFVSLALVGTALMTLAAKTKIDMVFVNVTMQTFAVFAIAAAYGSRLAVATMALYLLEGA